MDNTRQQIVDSINANTNILVTVSTNPTVDELSSALGLTILLNNLEKRATAVFSGAIPSAINFLDPTKTFEDTADSLRDFIIALDKEKADHLRYKVDGDVVKIFITPYRTTLSQKDLEFSQGDYNVELVIAVGVKDQDHLDKALAAHGKILHDATVVTITSGSEPSTLGSIDWHDPMASSLGEIMVSLADGLKTDKALLDEQISTAFLTGIVSATDRFSNDRTSSRVMTMAAQLMAAGANQQLIAAKLAEAHDIGPGAVAGKIADDTPAESAAKPESKPQNGSELSIERQGKKSKKPKKRDDSQPAPVATEPAAEEPKAEEVPGEKELEAQLSAVATPPIANSMEDIEQALKDATSQLAEEPQDVPSPIAAEQVNVEPVVVEPVSAPSDSPLPPFPPQPDFVPQQPVETETPFAPAPPQPGLADAPQPTAPTEPDFAPIPEPTPLAEPSLPPLPPLPDFGVPEAPAPESSMIINDHGSFSDQPPSTGQPINSINAGPSAGDATIDPFAAPLNTDTNATFAPQATPFESIPSPTVPLETPQFGTPEGAAQLGAMPQAAPVAEPAFDQTPEIPSLPPLPPLPPLPSDGSLPPLPPPPPMPGLGQPVAGMSGAVSGDIFGDAAAPAPAHEPAAPATPPEPGQYRIPGQG